MKKTLIYTALLAALFSVQACYYDNEEELYGTTEVTAFKWSGDVQPIINTNCAVPGCHVAGNGLPVLDSYAGVKDIVDNGGFETRVLTDRDMPPSTPLNAEQLAKLQAWFDNGAPED